MKTRIKSGATRHVILWGNWAFKIPRLTGWVHFLNGLLANLQEKAFAPTSERLCPVLFSLPGGFLIVQARTEPLTDEQWAALDKRSYRSFTSNRGIGFLPVEYKRDSFGNLDGVLVAVDYGS